MCNLFSTFQADSSCPQTPSVTLLCLVKVARWCPTLCDPMDCIVYGILQSRILVLDFPFSRGSSQPKDQTQVSCIVGRFFTI